MDFFIFIGIFFIFIGIFLFFYFMFFFKDLNKRKKKLLFVILILVLLLVFCLFVCFCLTYFICLTEHPTWLDDPSMDRRKSGVWPEVVLPGDFFLFQRRAFDALKNNDLE